MLSNPSVSWYAVRVKSNREWTTAESLKGKGLEVCLPCYSESRGGSARAAESPLFPGYLFCRFDVTRRLPILMAPGVVHIVSCGKTPQPVDQREMETLLSVVESGLPVRPHPFIEIGQRIELERGPLAGAEGVILACAGEEKFIASVSLLQRSLAVKIDRGWIRPVAPRANPQMGAMAYREG